MSHLVDALAKYKGLDLTVLSSSYVTPKYVIGSISPNVSLIHVSPLNFSRVLSSIAKGGFDVIHVHGELKLNALISGLKGVIKAPLLYSIHGNLMHEVSLREESNLVRMLPGIVIQHYLAKRADVIITVSQKFATILTEFLKVTQAKVRVIYNGCVWPEANTHSARKDAKQMPTILFIGVLSPIKGIDVLLEAVKRVQTKCQLILVGKRTNYFTELINNYQSLFCSGKVLHYDFVTNEILEKLYSAAQVFVLPSRQDSFPLVTFEAMARGVPVIVSDQVGTSEIMSNGVNGFIFRVNDVDELTYQLETLLTDEKVARRFAEGGRRLVRNFIWEKIAERYINLYEDVLAHV
jgi:glycosyltransferase involved in cell wall biosynthesis